MWLIVASNSRSPIPPNSGGESNPLATPTNPTISDAYGDDDLVNPTIVRVGVATLTTGVIIVGAATGGGDAYSISLITTHSLYKAHHVAN